MKIGTVPYINGLPLTHFLKENTIKAPPSQLVLMLLEGKVDVALVPVVSIIKHNLFMHPTAGIIGCDGQVDSVGFFTRSYINNLSEIKSIYMDRESQTSVFLAKTMLKKHFGVSLYDLEFCHHDNQDMADAKLLIGDKALFNNNKNNQYWDLGKIWKDKTGAGFMFACWASKKPLTDAEIATLSQARKQGVSHISEIVSQLETPIQDKANKYLSSSIIYEPTDNIKTGLKIFRSYLKEYQYIESGPKAA